MRAEARFISRYIPQKSNEERLTGHLVSEADNSVSVLRNRFLAESQERYSESREMDFLYYDMSQGGKVEKQSGADLGFIVIVDLPDHPFVVKTLVFQAKKITSSRQLDVAQCSTLAKNDPSAAYLFYDMDGKTRSSPMVLTLDDHSIRKGCEEAQKNNNKTFSVSFDDVLDGLPFSLYVLRQIEKAESGKVFGTLEEAMCYFRSLTSPTSQNQGPFDGPIGVVSLGKRITFQPDSESGLRVSV